MNNEKDCDLKTLTELLTREERTYFLIVFLGCLFLEFFFNIFFKTTR